MKGVGGRSASWSRRLGIVVCLAPLASTACDPKGAIQDIIDNASGRAQEVIKTAVDGLKQTIDRLDRVIDEQRGKLKQDAWPAATQERRAGAPPAADLRRPLAA